MSRAETGCSGCGGLGHNVRSCLTEGAAEHFDRAGNPRRAAQIRRQLAGLERARQAPVLTVGAIALARRLA